MKTITLELPKDIKIVDILVPTITSTKHSWNTDGQQLTGTLNKGKIILTFPKDDEVGTININISPIAEKEFKKLIIQLNQTITRADINKTVFKGFSMSNLKNGTQIHLNENLMLLKDISKVFSSIQIKDVMIYDTPQPLTHNSVFDKLTLVLNPNTSTIKSTESSDGFLEKYKDMKDYVTPHYQGAMINVIKDEPVTPLLMRKEQIGAYYPQRNLILVYFNPFKNLNLDRFYKLQKHEYLFNILTDLKQTIMTLNPKTITCQTFKLKVMVVGFYEKNKGQINAAKEQIEKLNKQIPQQETTLTKLYTDRTDYKQTISMLDVVEEDQLKNFITEVKKVSNQKIVTSVTTDGGTLNITYKPTTIKAHLDRNVEGTEDGPLTECFIGQITVHIHGNGKIMVSCDHPTTKGNPHPHATEDGTPCLGSGDGVTLIHKLIGQRKFADFVYVFWMWIKKWRNNDCYVHTSQYIDDRLKQGFPVFNQKGKRLTINDKTLIEGEILIPLEKHKNHDKNFKKYKGYVSQK